MISIAFDYNKINLAMDRITKAAENAVRPAAQAGAQVFYEEVKANVREGQQAEHYFYGTASKAAPKGSKKAFAYRFTKGNLKRSIYQYYNKRLSTPAKAVYSISWNHKEAPYGYMVEYGTSNAPAKPFLRPAYDAALAKALQAVQERMAEEVNKATK